MDEERKKFVNHAAMIMGEAIAHEVRKLRDTGLFTREELVLAIKKAEHSFGVPMETDEGLCSHLQVGWTPENASRITGVPQEEIERQCDSGDIFAPLDDLAGRVLLARDIIELKEEKNG